MEQGPTNLTVSASGDVSWTPLQSQVGSHSVTIRVMAITVTVFVLLKAGLPLSCAMVVRTFVPGPWPSVGVQNACE